MRDNQSSPLYLLIGIAFVAMAGEYYFLQLEPMQTKLYLIGLKFFSKGGYFFRVIFTVLYPLTFALKQPTLKDERGLSNKHKGNRFAVLWIGWFIISAFLLVTMHKNPYYLVCYPVGMIGLLVSGYAVGKLLRKRPKREKPVQNDSRKDENKYSFHFKGADGSWVNIANPFRGVLVIGGAGAGKSASVAEPIIAQAVEKEYCGIIYDYKFPTLTNFAYEQYRQSGSNVSFWVINFEDMANTHRVNPLNPRYITSPAFASEFALAIINNLMPETIAKTDFWTRSAQSLLTATIYYQSKYYPQYCTLPHVINMIVYENYLSLLRLLSQDYECASMIRAIMTAVEMDASNQTAGMISTLQLGLSRINTPEIAYVMSGDEFSLNINDPKDPKVLCIGTSSTLCDTFSPVISCLITVALKLMNQQGKQHSYVLLDEGPTLFVPKLDQLPATARSNKIATIYLAQDFSQMKKEYGLHESEAIIANLNNQFFGRVANLNTAEYVSRLFGKTDRLMRSEGMSDSRQMNASLGFDTKQSAGSYGSSVNYSLQERCIIYPQDLLNLQPGQFMGNTVETENPSFFIQFNEHDFGASQIPVISQGVDVNLNFQRIILEVRAIMKQKIKPATKAA